jgi:hypothetical protein
MAVAGRCGLRGSHKLPFDLRQQLEAFVSGQCTAVALTEGLSALCRAEPEAAWDALSLIDQYHRRGKISVEVYRTVSHGIERQQLERQSPHPGASAAPEADAYADPDATVPGRAGNAGAVAVPALNTELNRARVQLQRYQNCLAMLVKINRRNRGALARALKDLKASRTQAADYHQQLKHDPTRRHESLSRAGESDAHPDTRDGYRRQWQARLPLVVLLATLVLSIGASPVR